MQPRAQLGQIAERLGHPGREVLGVRGGEAQAIQPVDLVDPREQLGEIIVAVGPRAAEGADAVI